MDLGLEGKVALVMGASKGIGRGVAGALAREGARVALASRSQERLDEAVAEVGEGATAFVADAMDLERLARLPLEVAEAFGSVDILVTNTGGPPPGGALGHGFEEWEDAYRSLVLAPRVVAGDGITVNTVATGRFATDRMAELGGSIENVAAAARSEVPAGRLGTVEEYGDLVAFLCSQRAAYITGTVIPIDGGLMRSTV